MPFRTSITKSVNVNLSEISSFHGSLAGDRILSRFIVLVFLCASLILLSSLSLQLRSLQSICSSSSLSNLSFSLQQILRSLPCHCSSVHNLLYILPESKRLVCFNCRKFLTIISSKMTLLHSL